MQGNATNQPGKRTAAGVVQDRFVVVRKPGKDSSSNPPYLSRELVFKDRLEDARKFTLAGDAAGWIDEALDVFDRAGHESTSPLSLAVFDRVTGQILDTTTPHNAKPGADQ